MTPVLAPHRHAQRLAAAAVIHLLLVATGCEMPQDPRGTFDRVRGGELRVGVLEDPPWASFVDSEPEGLEVELVQEFANQIDSSIVWRRGSEARLMEALKSGGLDLVIGGVTESSRWAKEVALSQPYHTYMDERHVVAVPPGENRWLLELEKFLQQKSGTIVVPGPLP